MSRYGTVSPGGLRFAYPLTPWVKRLILANTLFWLLTWTGLIPFQLVRT